MSVNQSILGLLLACASISPLAPPAQVSTNLGSVNVTSSSTTMVTVTLPSAGTVSSIAVVTQGIPNADFTDAGGGSCSTGASYQASATCTVNVKFTPKFPGTRYGAVVLTGAGGPIATQPIQATGIAPQAAIFPSASQFVNAAVDVGNPSAVVVDPAGNLYFTEIYFANNVDTGKVWKLTASSMYQTTTQIGSGFVAPLAVALDGTGNVYLTDGGNPMIPAGLYKETLSNGDYIQTEISNGFVNPASIAVDGSGNVYVADAGMLGIPGGVYKETLSNGTYTQTEIGTGITYPSGVAVDASGNVYISNDGAGVVYKETPSGSGYTQTTISKGWSGISRIAVDSVGNFYVEAISPTGRPTLLYRESPVNGGYVETPVNTQQCSPIGVAIEESGNLFVPNAVCDVLQIDVSASPPFSFAETAEGTTSYDSPQTVTVLNLGNAALDISQLSFPEDFSEDSHAANECKSSESLQAGGVCNLAIDFSPVTAVGSSSNSLSETVDLTTNSLNVSTQQTIAVSGVEYPPTATMAVNVSADPSVVGNPVTFSATVTGSSTVPTGTVTFSSGSTALSTMTLSGGVASYSTTFPIGSYSITAAYSGDSNYQALSKTFTESVVAPPPLAPLSAVNFKTVAVGSVSSAVPISVTFNTAETLGSVAVLTQGAAGLDFTNAGGGTCIAGTAFAANATCTVNTIFKPTYSGPRYGAVVLYDTSGKPLGFGYLQGTGQSAHAIYSPGNLSIADQSVYIFPTGLALDGSGDLYVADAGDLEFMGSDPGFLYKETPKGDGTYSRIKIGSDLLIPSDVAIDGAGNVYIADAGWTALLKETLQADGSYVQSTFGFGLVGPSGVAVDGAGNAYVGCLATGALGAADKETFANGAYIQSQIGVGLAAPGGIAVDGGGNVYVADFGRPTAGSFIIPPNVYKESPSASGYDQTPIGSGWDVFYPIYAAVDASANVYVLAQASSTVVEETPQPDGSYVQSTPDVQYDYPVSEPGGLTFDSRGGMYIDDTFHDIVYFEDFGNPAALRFSATSEGFTSDPQVVTLTNSGNAALTISSIVATGDFAETNTCGGSVAVQATCTISVTFNPATEGSLTGAVTVTSNSTGSPQIMPLTGTGTNPAPGIAFSPANLTFPSQPSGSTSTAQTMTVTNSGSAPLTISSMKSQYDNYTETNTCTASLSAGGTCTISVIFTPKFGGNQQGSLIITDNAAGSPQSIPLDGLGGSVNLVVSPTTLSIASPGGSATDSIQVSSDYGFSGAVSLACKVSYQGSGTANEPPTCAFSPTQGQVSANSPLGTALTVSTTAVVSAAKPNKDWLHAGGALAFLLVFGFVPRRRRKIQTLMAILAIAVACTCIGCGGGSSGGGGTTIPPNPGTTLGSYQVVVTATSGTVTASTSVALTLQ